MPSTSNFRVFLRAGWLTPTFEVFGRVREEFFVPLLAIGFLDDSILPLSFLASLVSRILTPSVLTSMLLFKNLSLLLYWGPI